jgi:hypothetical protein
LIPAARGEALNQPLPRSQLVSSAKIKITMVEANIIASP